MILRQRVGRQFKRRSQPGANGAQEASCFATANEAADSNPLALQPDPGGDPLDAIWEAEWQRHILALATERVKKLVSYAQFQIFDLHVFGGWAARDVARTLGVTMAQVYLAKLRVGRRFKQEVEALKASDEAAGP